MLKKWLNKDLQDFIIKYTPIVLYVIMIGAVFCALMFEDYLSIYIHISDAGSVSFIVSLLILAIVYRSKLCPYNKVIAWSFLGINILNKICQLSLNESDFNLYINLYIPILLIPTSILVTYYLIKSNYDSQ